MFFTIYNVLDNKIITVCLEKVAAVKVLIPLRVVHNSGWLLKPILNRGNQLVKLGQMEAPIDDRAGIEESGADRDLFYVLYGIHDGMVIWIEYLLKVDKSW